MVALSKARKRRFSVVSIAALALLGITLPAAAATYWTVPGVLKSFFSSSKKVTHKRIELSDAAAQSIAKKLGVPQIKRDWVVYVGETESRRDGYAIVDAEMGMHEPIDFAVSFSKSGAVARVEILEYREPYGNEVRSDRFRAQFLGKTAADPIAVGNDIDIVSGASISSKSIAVGVKRDALILQTALGNGSL